MRNARTEYDALPEWAKALVDGMRSAVAFGLCHCPNQVAPAKSRDTVFVNAKDDHGKIAIGLRGAMRLAEDLQKSGD